MPPLYCRKDGSYHLFRRKDSLLAPAGSAQLPVTGERGILAAVCLRISRTRRAAPSRVLVHPEILHSTPGRLADEGARRQDHGDLEALAEVLLEALAGALEAERQLLSAKLVLLRRSRGRELLHCLLAISDQRAAGKHVSSGRVPERECQPRGKRDRRASEERAGLMLPSGPGARARSICMWRDFEFLKVMFNFHCFLDYVIS